ncbi:tRNA (guanine-N(7)-)-methyltransferase [Nocardioides baekrokdamisoli]|uniref:tRNA (guanine-N(7)-)-methyltransferase n=1 Tax=Nocardioides baekrokdamisoli TaxID=1804624 RepID=A0A3G9IHR4_9ACTN|nr:tRNA (guanosine(46)-N7)-methyltransferase TrmB [Nocardioides baekrokdamisoli]BBH17896.1 tRNA (guanine-N(7)-)-methyltransferase [Nocardioides baekrokdamisoli]
MTQRVAPARPGGSLTEDGRQMREIVSYARRGARFSDRQQRIWDEYAPQWVIDPAAVEADDFDWSSVFGRDAPLILEIGSGVGETLGAVERPDANILGVEVWVPGVADTLGRLAAAGRTNVRMLSIDAVWLLRERIAPGALQELWLMFPDPWHKARHHKRRIVQPGFAELVTDRLVDGGIWRLATDWLPYAEHMQDVIDPAPGLRGGVVDRWPERPLTKFERRGIAKERQITDLAYLKG